MVKNNLKVLCVLLCHYDASCAKGYGLFLSRQITAPDFVHKLTRILVQHIDTGKARSQIRIRGQAVQLGLFLSDPLNQWAMAVSGSGAIEQPPRQSKVTTRNQTICSPLDQCSASAAISATGLCARTHQTTLKTNMTIATISMTVGPRCSQMKP